MVTKMSVSIKMPPYDLSMGAIFWNPTCLDLDGSIGRYEVHGNPVNPKNGKYEKTYWPVYLTDPRQGRGTNKVYWKVVSMGNGHADVTALRFKRKGPFGSASSVGSTRYAYHSRLDFSSEYKYYMYLDIVSARGDVITKELWGAKKCAAGLPFADTPFPPPVIKSGP